MGLRKAAVVLTFAVTVAACGAGEVTDIAGSTTSTEGTAPATTAPKQTNDPETTAAEGPVAPIESAFPELVVADVASGDQITLRQAAGAGTPVAMWFWFPH